MPNTTHLEEFVFDTFSNCYGLMKEPLANAALFAQKLAERIRVKAGDNEQFDFDVELDRLIKDGLVKHGVTGWVFSEESGVYTHGAPKYRVVFDPFCNSSLASRGFRDGAVGLTIFDYDSYEVILSAIMDYQTGLTAVMTDGQTRLYQLPGKQPVQIARPLPERLQDAWVVLTLENQEERAHLAEAQKLLQAGGRIIISSGHLYWLRLSIGTIDVYADPYGGEALYEMFAASVAQGAGCLVTDREGVAFDPSAWLKQFEHNQNVRFYPVAARSQTLHAQALELLK